MTADLEILARQLKQIAEGEMPDGTAPSASMLLWAEGWLLSLDDLGIKPALAWGTF